MSLINLAIMRKENEIAATEADSTLAAGPLLVFVLGAPCSGKSTLCTALSARYDLSHFSLGDELRSLVSNAPGGAAARIRPRFTNEELDIFRSNLHAGTLGPIHLTPRYVRHRVFPTGCDLSQTRMLIDGFPRDAKRWSLFKEFASPAWRPGERTLLVVLDVEREVALKRFVKRERKGDVFERRFEEHERLVPEIVEVMRKDGVTIVHVDKEEDVQAVVERLGGYLGRGCL